MRKRLILGAVLAAALAAAPAHAAEPTITTEVGFDDVPVGANVAEAYAAKGVRFGSPPSFRLGDGVRCTGLLATVDGGISGRDLGFGCRQNETDFEFNVAMQFADEQSSVSFVLRSRSGHHEPLRIRAYDLAGNVLESREVRLPVNFP